MKNHPLSLLATTLILLSGYAHAAAPQNTNNLDARITKNQNSITYNSHKLAEYKQDSRRIGSALLIYGQSNDRRVAKDETLITNNEQAIAAIHQKVDVTTKQAQINDQSINQTSRSLHSDGKLIKNNKQGISENKQQLVSEQHQIQANTGNIAKTNQTLHVDEQQIQSNTQEISNLRKDFERMANNINGAYAEAAALNGLTEPHNVGNIMVSLGLGHHGNADALAFGAGERLNEHLTAKVGAAYNSATSTMTSYMGVGYEF